MLVLEQNAADVSGACRASTHWVMPRACALRRAPISFSDAGSRDSATHPIPHLPHGWVIFSFLLAKFRRIFAGRRPASKGFGHRANVVGRAPAAYPDVANSELPSRERKVGHLLTGQQKGLERGRKSKLLAGLLQCQEGWLL